MNATVRYKLIENGHVDHKGDMQLVMFVEAAGRLIASQCVANICAGDDVKNLLAFLHSGGRIEIPDNERAALDELARFAAERAARHER